MILPRHQSISTIFAVATMSTSPPFTSLPRARPTRQRKSSGSLHCSILQRALSCRAFAFSSSSGMQYSGSWILSALTQPRSTWLMSLVPSSMWTVPGQSMRLMRAVNVTYCHTLVSPGIGAALQQAFSLSVLMTEDLPTLGQPTNPTESSFLSRWNWSNCRSRLIREPFPNGLVMDARKATVGRSLFRADTHFAVTHMGTRSTLFRINTRCFCGACLLRYPSRAFDLVPGGSRASSTWHTTSEESNTLQSYSQMRLDCPAFIFMSLPCYRQSYSSGLLSSHQSLTSCAKSQSELLASLTFFLRAFGPKVCSQVSTSRSLKVRSVGSCRRFRGSFLARTRTERGWLSAWASSTLYFSMAFWSIVLTFPNHFLSGWTRAEPSGRWFIFFRSGFWLYMLSLLIVPLLRQKSCRGLPAVLGAFRSGLVDEPLFAPLTKLLKFFLFFYFLVPFPFTINKLTQCHPLQINKIQPFPTKLIIRPTPALQIFNLRVGYQFQQLIANPDKIIFRFL